MSEVDKAVEKVIHPDADEVEVHIDPSEYIRFMPGIDIIQIMREKEREAITTAQQAVNAARRGGYAVSLWVANKCVGRFGNEPKR